MRSYKLLVLAALIIGVVFVSGCTTNPTGSVVDTGQQTTEQPKEEVSAAIISAPSSARTGDKLIFSWRVEGPSTTIPHTAIHYDYVPHPNVFEGTTPEGSGYPKFTQEFAQGQFSIPNTFTASITAEKAGTLYYRGHAIVNGEQYWTEEESVYIAEEKPKEQQTTQQPKMPANIDYTLEADDNGFYMEGGRRISSIIVDRNREVNILFKVRTDDVYYGGLDFRGCGMNTGAKPGESAVFSFVADNPCTITSYWPSSGVTKQTLDIRVTSTEPGTFPRGSSGGGGY